MAASPLSPAEFTSAVTAITSAFGDPTRRGIYLFAVEQAGSDPTAHEATACITAGQVAERFELHPNVARHHLDKLTAAGYLEIVLRRAEGAGAGRPSKRYRLSSERVELDLPVRHQDLLVSLLGRALAELPASRAEALAEEVGTEYGQAMATAMGGRVDGAHTFRAALHAVADALTAHGFAAHAEQQGFELRIVSETCPFGGAPIEHPVICAVDRGMVKGMLAGLSGFDADPAIRSSRPMGDDVCVTAMGQ